VTRIIAGAARGRRLQTPAGATTRPTSDRVREALFSALESELGTLAGRRFLDAYAGSGAVGLEARSRGAGEVLLVEAAPRAVAVIRANAAALGFTGIDVVASRVERLAKRSPKGGGFDVAFFDPPYDDPAADLAGIIDDLAAAGWFAPSGIVVVERPRRAAWRWPSHVAHVRERRYGETMLWYGRWALPESP
jgi:16S rRNA (guanine966-N2)-methyltransferase